MNILITRPLIESEDLMRKLFSLGHNIIHVPTLKIIPIKMELLDAKSFDAMIFTSANAIRNLKIKNIDHNKPCFCVGAITEKILRKSGYKNTFSAGGTVNALKNLIVNSNLINENSKILYFCGDHLSFDLHADLISEGLQVQKIINYKSEKITDLNNESLKIVKSHPPNLVFVYSLRRAQSFISIAKNYSLLQLMTESKVMCISSKVLDEFKKAGWKDFEIFQPGDELLKIR